MMRPLEMAPDPASAADPLARATALVERASERDIPLRIIGGLAVRALCPEFPPRAVDDQDLDLASLSSTARRLGDFLVEEGFEPDARFNALHGTRQLRFAAADPPLNVDVMLDRLVMSHELDFSDRLDRSRHTLDPADLLLSKLQIVELNEKDLHDIAYLLAALPLAPGDEDGAISLERFGEVLCCDWGWWRTATGNLDRVASRDGDVRAPIPAGAPFDPVAQATQLRAYAEEVPKTRGWKLRSRIGERMRWYELPEEV